MSRKSEEYLRGVPMKPYDLIREGLIMLAVVAAIIIVLALVLKSPDAPTVRGEDVAKNQPIAFLKTCVVFLSGGSELQDYGPPYTPDRDNAQRALGIAPANWFGVRFPIDAARDMVLTPLEKVAVLNREVAAAMQTYKSAAKDSRKAWTKAYSDALDKAEVAGGQVKIPAGEYGPVPVLMNGMLDLGKAGLLEGALTSSVRLPYTLDSTKAMLFFQEDVDQDVADSQNMRGDEWGITHEVGHFPGPWWLWPYAIWYQFSFLKTAPNADLVVGLIMALLFLLLFFAPFIPVLNRLPKWIGIYRIIWRDWYARQADAGRAQKK